MNYIYDIIEETRQRSALYFGESISSITRLHDFLGGFEFALNKLNANKYAPRRVISTREEPLYKNPLATYLVKLSCNSGYICLVKTETEYRLVCRIYKYDRDIKLFLKSCFGDMPKWKEVQIDNFPFDKETDKRGDRLVLG